MKKRKGLKTDLFLAAFLCYMIATVCQYTMLTEYGFVGKVCALARYAAFAMAFVKIVWDFFPDTGTGRFDLTAVPYARFVAEAFVGILGAACAVVSGNNLPVFVVLFVLAARNVKISYVFTWFFRVQVLLVCGIVLLSRLGIMKDLLFKRNSVPIRHALGYTYPSIFISIVVFLVLVYLWIGEERITRKDIIYLELVNSLLYILTDSRLGFVFLTVVFGVLYFFRTEKGKQAEAFLIRSLSKPAFGICYDGLAVWLSLLILVCCFLYSRGLLKGADSLLSGRIRYTVSGIEQYGFSLLGRAITWIGFGGSDKTDQLLTQYNFIDSSYAQILINYGILFYGALMAVLVLISHYIRKTQNLIRCLVFAGMLIYCMIEPSLLELHMNPFLLLAAPAVFSFRGKGKNITKDRIR